MKTETKKSLKELLFGTKTENYPAYVTNYEGHFLGIIRIIFPPYLIYDFYQVHKEEKRNQKK